MLFKRKSTALLLKEKEFFQKQEREQKVLQAGRDQRQKLEREVKELRKKNSRTGKFLAAVAPHANKLGQKLGQMNANYTKNTRKPRKKKPFNNDGWMF